MGKINILTFDYCLQPLSALFWKNGFATITNRKYVIVNITRKNKKNEDEGQGGT